MFDVFWRLSKKLIDVIEFVDDIDNCKIEYKKSAQILDVIKIACNPRDLLSDEYIEEALKKITLYQFHKTSFLDSIDTLKIMLSNNK